MNRRVRDPYARWCERRTPSPQGGGAAYSITSCPSVHRCCCHSRIILIVQSIISNEKSKNLYLLLMSCFTNLKNVVCFLNMSTVNQVREAITAVVNGIQRILYENDNGMSPFSNASVARPIPQPGQGIVVANLNKQIV